MVDLVEKKKLAPSRRRYEAKNPALTVRVPKELHDRVQALATCGLTQAAVLRLGLTEGIDRGDAYRQGYEAGLQAVIATFPDLFGEDSDYWPRFLEIIPDD